MSILAWTLWTFWEPHYWQRCSSSKRFCEHCPNIGQFWRMNRVSPRCISVVFSSWLTRVDSKRNWKRTTWNSCDFLLSSIIKSLVIGNPANLEMAPVFFPCKKSVIFVHFVVGPCFFTGENSPQKKRKETYETWSKTCGTLWQVVLEALSCDPIWVLDHVSEVHQDLLIASCHSEKSAFFFDENEMHSK